MNNAHAMRKTKNLLHFHAFQSVTEISPHSYLNVASQGFEIGKQFLPVELDAH